MIEVLESSKTKVRDYQCKWYKVKVKQKPKSTLIKMECALCILNTKALPSTSPILDKILPSIYDSKCFNEGELPFKIEVKNTETGHLFEHILLEYLCECKIKLGYKQVTYCGETCWNWKKEKRGVFNITINVSEDESNIFSSALDKSFELLNYIIFSSMRDSAITYRLDISNSSLVSQTI